MAKFMVQFNKPDKNQAGRRAVLAVNIREISTEALAYLGDCVIELKVREILVSGGMSAAGNLNNASHLYVTAKAQANAMQNILPLLSEDESAVYKRGRNMSGGNVPKTATVAEYRIATGMEVLFGYLYLFGNKERLDELFLKAYPSNG
jgi:ribonuclease-3 family protein